MKKIIIIIINIIIFMQIFMCIANAEEDTNSNNIDTNEIIASQSSSLDISSFLDSAKEYSSNVLEDTNISDVFSSAVSGSIDNSNITKKILNLFCKETLTAIASIASIIIIVLIHSILKNISDGLENNSVSQMAYYVAYILIVSIIMKNFADIITLIKTSIENMVGFINCLFPVLITLLISSGGIKSATFLEPIILFVITFAGNIITKIIIPFSLISLALSVVSNISDKVQVSKLSKFINGTTVWILGIILTIFVGVSSLEGSITKGVDVLTVKTTKAAVSSCIPVVGKILRRCSRNSYGMH